MGRGSIAAWMVGAAVALLSPPVAADLPHGTSIEAWLRSGGAVLDLQVAPVTARVELDGDRIQTGPALVTPGVHLLVIRAVGRREHREIIRVPTARRTRKRVTLEPMQARGRLDVRIAPHHARMLVDGRLVGVPARAIILTAGRHRIQIVAVGYRTVRRVVRVPRGATLTLRIEMQPDRRRRRRPRVAMSAAPCGPVS